MQAQMLVKFLEVQIKVEYLVRMAAPRTRLVSNIRISLRHKVYSPRPPQSPQLEISIGDRSFSVKAIASLKIKMKAQLKWRKSRVIKLYTRRTRTDCTIELAVKASKISTL